MHIIRHEMVILRYTGEVLSACSTFTRYEMVSVKRVDIVISAGTPFA